MMDTLDELESLAQSSLSNEPPITLLEAETIRQYMDLFDLSEGDAIQKIHDLQSLVPQKKPATTKTRAAAYLVKLQGPLCDAHAVKFMAGLTETPEVMAGTDDSGREAHFCRVDHEARSKIAAYFCEKNLRPSPVFLQLTQAEKSLSHVSAAPTLGLDTTLPQHRACSPTTVFHPLQDEYPVWHFMYGPLADAKELGFVLRLSEPPEYLSAVVAGGRLLSWNALVDAYTDGSQTPPEIQGKAYLVRSKKEEEALRFSVTDKFEVVRCGIRFTGNEELVYGLTFRYSGADLQ